MKNIKNNITFKYFIGLSLITVLTLLIQSWIFKLYNLVQFELIRTLLLSVIVIPVVGLYIITKVCCKKSFDFKPTYLLTKIFIISIVLTILSAIYVVFRVDMFGNVDDGFLSISEDGIRNISQEEIKTFEEAQIITFLIIANIKFIIKALIASTLYIGVLILVLVRHWVNNIHSEKKEAIKQIKQLLIAITVIIMLEMLANVWVNIKQGNIQMSMTIQLESDVTDIEKEEIENKLKEMDKIINYRYMDISEASNEFIETMEEKYGFDDRLIEDFKDRIHTIIKNEKFELTVHNKNIEYVKKELEGMNGIEKIYGTNVEV